MDPTPFDELLRNLTLAPSRRAVLGRSPAIALGFLAPGVPEGTHARKRKTRKQRAIFNEYGCVEVSGYCKNAGQCCSGISEGKKGKQRCKAHDTGGCRAGQSSCEPGVPDVCTTSVGDAGVCETTTGNAGYCSGELNCRTCTRDRDCQEEFGSQAACAACTACAEGTACAKPDD